MKSMKIFSIKISLNKKELDQMKDLFIEHDKNFDGSLDLDEFNKIIREV